MGIFTKVTMQTLLHIHVAAAQRRVDTLNLSSLRLLIGIPFERWVIARDHCVYLRADSDHFVSIHNDYVQ